MKSLLAGIVLAFGLVCFSHASTAGLKAGRDYYLVPGTETGEGATSGEVIEAFSYSCAHCAEFQPFMRDLETRAPQGTSVLLLPVIFQPAWESSARAFYAAQNLGVLNATHQLMFSELQNDTQAQQSVAAIANIYAKYGVSAPKFVAAANTKVVHELLRRDYTLARSLGIDRTPTLIVNRKYRVIVDESKGITPQRAVDIVIQLLK